MTEEIKKLEAKAEELATAIDKKLEAASAQAKEAANSASQKVSTELKAEIKALLDNWTKTQEQLDKLSIKVTETGEIVSARPHGLYETLHKAFTENKGLKEWAAGGDGRKSRDFFMTYPGGSFHTKTVASMTPSSNFSGQVTTPMGPAGIFYDPDRPEHIRDYMTVIPTGTDTIWYNYESAITNSTQMTAPGSDKGKSSVTITRASEAVKKISTYVILAEEMLSDFPAMSGYLSARFMSKLKLLEDTQILYGTGATVYLQGITPLASVYDGSQLPTQSVKAQQWDVLRAAVKQARVAEYRPSLIVLHPGDVMDIDVLKDSTGNYLTRGIFNDRPNVAGVPILETTAITEGDFLVGDFRNGATLWDRMQAQVKFSDQDQDNFVKNNITVVFEERLAQTVERASAFIYGSFATALACGSATA